MEEDKRTKAGNDTDLTKPWMFVLIGRDPVPMDPQDPLEWAAWMEQARQSGRIYVGTTCIADFRVSTVFLGLDHQLGSGLPVLFETMIFFIPNDTRSFRHYAAHPFEDYCERYATWLDAVAGHTRAVDVVLRNDPVSW